MSPPGPDIPHAAIDALPEGLRAPTHRWFTRLIDEQHYDGRLPDSLVRLVAVSEFAAGWLQRYPEWIETIASRLDKAPEFDFAAIPDEDEDSLKRRIRQHRHQTLIHILWRELECGPPLSDTVAQISALADTLLAAAARHAQTELQARFGSVVEREGHTSSAVILGMGKLGGFELNFSSDIDIVFLYDRDGESNGERVLSGQEYFRRFARIVVRLLDDVTEDGFAFRVDTRLRPFGDSGPPVTSFAALEHYLLEHGRDWERYAYIKARAVGPPVDDGIHQELFAETITPFVYRRYLDFGVFDALRNMHALIAAEVKKKELADNVKLGAGGIRDIEFAVQSLQLVRGGREAELQQQNLLSALPQLAGRDGIEQSTVAALSTAYEFLRRLENFIQAIRDRQTHELPTDPLDQARLSLAMGYPDWMALKNELDGHRERVAAVFSQLAFGDESASAVDVSRRYSELFEARATAEDWQAALPESASTALTDTLVAFGTNCDHQQIDSVAHARLNRFIGNLLIQVLPTRNPERALTRTLSVVENVLRRSAYIALLNENPAVLNRLVALCEQSAYLTQQIGRYPVLLDELLDPRVYTEPATRDVLNAEIVQRLQVSEGDSESQTEVLARFQRASQFRIAAADFSGSLPLMKVSDRLTELAEVVLQKALSMAWRDMCERYGVPESASEDAVSNFSIVAYGKLGGLELSYGSDLDLVFLHDMGPSAESTSDTAAIEKGVFLSRLVRRLVHILSTQTGSGVLYEVDTRLRPDGQSGLLVSHIDAFERYQMNDAWTWEHQALLRARAVGGDPRISARFEAIRAKTLSSAVNLSSLRDDVIGMRNKMRQQLDHSDAERFDLKQGNGGIADIEFLVQYLVLREAPNHASVFEYSDNIRQLAALATCGCLDVATASGLQEIYRHYRARVHHLALDEQPPLIEQAELTAERDTIRQLWADILGE